MGAGGLGGEENTGNYVQVSRLGMPLVNEVVIPLALKGVSYRPASASVLLRRNLLVYGIGGVVLPFVGIKAIDIAVGLLKLV